MSKRRIAQRESRSRAIVTPIYFLGGGGAMASLSIKSMSLSALSCCVVGDGHQIERREGGSKISGGGSEISMR